MSSNESRAYEIMTELNVDYVLVIFGGVMGYSGDDINKFLWMVRIAEGEHPNEIRESDYFTGNVNIFCACDSIDLLANSYFILQIYHPKSFKMRYITSLYSNFL